MAKKKEKKKKRCARVFSSRCGFRRCLEFYLGQWRELKIKTCGNKIEELQEIQL